jgi:hypothetical protein
MLISLKFPEGVAFQPIMSNLEEKIIEEITQTGKTFGKPEKRQYLANTFTCPVLKISD